MPEIFTHPVSGTSPAPSSMADDLTTAPGDLPMSDVIARVTAQRNQFRHDNTINPSGAQEGQAVEVWAVSGENVPLECAALFYTTDGSLPDTSSSYIPCERMHASWDPLAGYLTHWRAIVPAQVAQTVVRYRIGGWRTGTAQHSVELPDIWMVNPWASFWAVVIVNVWLSYPFFMIVILGALQSIPSQLSEAAQIDGANRVQYFRYVTLPLLQPTLIPITILSAITTFQMFNTVYLITQGGPITSAAKPGFTEFVMVYMYKRILGADVANPHFGFIAAFAVTLFIILAILTFLAASFSSMNKKEALA